MSISKRSTSVLHLWIGRPLAEACRAGLCEQYGKQCEGSDLWVSGVANWKDVVKYIMVGATTVQVCGLSLRKDTG